MNVTAIYKLFKQYPLVSTDTRKCYPDSIFIALKGDNFNGNKFARQALEKGCVYSIVDEVEYAEEGNERIILVNNCLDVLQRLANHHRRQLATKIIGITGTNGKTTTKELTASVLSQQCNILYTEGNLNNHIGVPLTLLKLKSEHELAIIEMGASHPGEIKKLCEIAEPDYGIITNVGKAHLEGFGSFEGVVNTKTEIYDYLRQKKNSVIFVRNEDTTLMKKAKGLNYITYGEGDSLYINGRTISCSPYLTLAWRSGKNGESHEISTQLIGDYNLNNALAAIAIGKFFGIKADKIDKGLSEYIPQNSRSQLKDTKRNHLIIDAYNANPTSMMAALENFHKMDVPHKILLLGDMKELGNNSRAEHQLVTDYLTGQNGFEKVILVGSEFAETKGHNFTIYPDVKELIKYLQEEQSEGNYILIKGSNSTNLQKVIEFL